MSTSETYALDVQKRFGKKVLEDYFADFGRISRFAKLESPEALIAFAREQYERTKENYKPEKADDTAKAGWSVEDEFLHFARLFLPRPLMDLGLLASWRDGNFRHFYRSVFDMVRMHYATRIVIPVRYDSEHGNVLQAASLDDVIACHALNRPDLAKKFFPPECGFLGSDAAIGVRHIANLIIALHLEDPAQQEVMATKGREFLQAKRPKQDQAMVSFLLAVLERDATGMCEQLEMIGKNFIKSHITFCTITMSGMYGLARQYVPQEIFYAVARPKNKAWFDEFIDLGASTPIPADFGEPFIQFPPDLAFIRNAMSELEAKA